MGAIDQKSETQTAAHSAVQNPIPYDCDQDLGISSFKNKVLGILRDHERSCSKAELDFVLDSCQRLNQQIYKEIKTRTPNDPRAEQLQDLKTIVSDISEYLILRTEFAGSLQRYDAGEESALNGSPRIFVQMGLSDVSQKLEDGLKRLESIKIGEKPFFEKVKSLSAVVLASLSLLSMRGTPENPDVKILENKTPTEINKKNDPDNAKLKLSTKDQGQNQKAAKPGLGDANSNAGQLAENSRPGETLRPGINAPANHRDRFDDIKIDFPLMSSIKDPLWVHTVYGRNNQGEFVKINRRTEVTGSSVEAHCLQELYSVTSGANILLSSPFGFGIDNIAIAQKDGSAVPFTWQPDKNEITIGQLDTATSKNIRVELSYELFEGKENLEMPEPSSVSLARSEYQQALISALKADPGRVEEVLDLLFSKYTYLTSSGVGAIIEKIPGRNYEEIYGNIGVGDCDSVSIVGAGLLNEAGITAGLICGHNEEDGALGNGHAKIFYLDENGEYQTYESTKKMKTGYFSLSLKQGDRDALETIVAKMRPYDDIEQRMADYKEFRETLEKILLDSYYDFYKKNPERVAADQRTFLTNLEELRESLPQGQKDIFSFGLLATGLMGVIGSGYLLARGASSAYRRSAVAELSNKIENPAHASESSKGFSSKLRNIESSMQSWLAHLKETFKSAPEICKLVDQLSGESLEKQQALLKYLLIIKVTSATSEYRKINSASDTVYSLALRNKIENIDTDVAGINQVFRMALKETGDKKSLVKFTEDLPKRVTKIIEEAVEINLHKSKAPKGTSSSQFGVKETQSKIRSQSRTDEFIGHREYRHGDPIQAIDWRVTARSGDGKVWVKEYAMPKFESQDKRPPVSVVVDVSTIRDGELADLAAFLMERDSSRRVESVTVCAFGEVLQRIEGRLVSSKLQGPKNIESVEHLVRSLLQKRAEINPPVNNDFSRYFGINLDLTHSSDVLFPIQLLSSERETMVFGNGLIR